MFALGRAFNLSNKALTSKQDRDTSGKSRTQGDHSHLDRRTTSRPRIYFQQQRSAMKVKEAMHKGVEWVGPDTPIIELAKLMHKHDVGAIPIGENDQLIGMMTDRDIVCKGLAEHSDPASLLARDVMTPGIHCCRHDDDLNKAVRHMEELKIRRLPVINKSKRMIGILSLGDVSGLAPNGMLSEYLKSVSAHHH